MKPYSKLNLKNGKINSYLVSKQFEFLRKWFKIEYR